MTDYLFSNGNVNLTGAGTLDEIRFVDDSAGLFSLADFTFGKDGDDLLIFPNNGSQIRVTEHFADDVRRVEVLVMSSGDVLDLTGPNILVSSVTNPALSAGNGPEVILGGSDSTDDIFGGGGDDRIFGGNMDGVFGEGGDDEITGGKRLLGGDGNDLLVANSFTQQLQGGMGDDTLYGDDRIVSVIYGDEGQDSIFANNGDDAANGGAGADTIDGGEGNDTLHGDDGDDVIMGGNGRDLIEGGAGSDFIDSGGNETGAVEFVSGGDGNDEIHGGAGRQRILGDDGDDLIFAAADDDTLEGGAGEDTLRAGHGDDRLFGGADDDTLIGEGGKDSIYGGDGDDALYGGAGNDYLSTFLNSANSGSGNDNQTIEFVDGGSGADEIRASRFSVADLYGGTGGDHYYLRNDISGVQPTYDMAARILDEGGNDTLDLNGNLVVYGFAVSGRDFTLTRQSGSATFTTVIESQYRPGFSVENFSFSDTGTFSIFESPSGSETPYFATSATSPLGIDSNFVEAGDGDDEVFLGQQPDFVRGNGGNDTLHGEGGDDVLIGGAGNDTLYGGEGSDTADYSRAPSAVVLTLHGKNASDDGEGGSDTFGSIENATGSAFSDVLFGSNGTNLIEGLSGDDTIDSRNGENDTIYGGAGDDHLQDRNGAGTIYGGDGNDEIFGGSGNDIIFGGAGQDILRGQGGADTFVFKKETAYDGTFDILHDFDHLEDIADIGDVIEFDPAEDNLSDFVHIYTSGAHTYIATNQAGSGPYTDIARISYSSSELASLEDFTIGYNLLVV